MSEILAETMLATRPHRIGGPKSILGGVVALAVALSTFAAQPAMADRRGDNLAAALAAIAIVGVIASQANRSEARPYDDKGGTYRVRQTPRLPGACVMELEDAYGDTHRVYSANCLSDRGYDDWRLPGDCAQTLRTHRGRERIYDAACLRRAGIR